MTLKRKCQESKKLKYDTCKWQCVTVNRPGKGWPKKLSPPQKKKERETRKSGRGATYSWNCSFLHFQMVLLFFCPHSTYFQAHNFAPQRGRNHTVPHCTALSWSNFCSQKTFPNDFLSRWYLYVLKVPSWISLFGQWSSPQTPTAHIRSGPYDTHTSTLCTLVTTGWGVGQRVVIIPLRVFFPFRL